jgi:hypothetical protein
MPRLGSLTTWQRCQRSLTDAAGAETGLGAAQSNAAQSDAMALGERRNLR